MWIRNKRYRMLCFNEISLPFDELNNFEDMRCAFAYFPNTFFIWYNLRGLVVSFFKNVIYFALKIQFLAKKPSKEQTVFKSGCICLVFWGYLRHIISIISLSIIKLLWDHDSRNALPIRTYYRPHTVVWLQCLVFFESHIKMKDKSELEG